MQNTDNTLVQQVLELDVRQLETADACAQQLTKATEESLKMSSSAVGFAQMAIRFALKSGEIMNRAKDLLPHGEFEAWLEHNAPQITSRTARKWMALAKRNVDSDLLSNPTIKGLQDAYVAAGILPEPEPKEGSATQERERPPFTLTFKTQWRSVSEWSKDAARDFLYDFDRLAQLARALKTEFGL